MEYQIIPLDIAGIWCDKYLVSGFWEKNEFGNQNPITGNQNPDNLKSGNSRMKRIRQPKSGTCCFVKIKVTDPELSCQYPKRS